MTRVISMWGEHGDRPEPDATNDALFAAFTASASIEVACTPTAAWDLVTTIGRIGEFSPECIGARWIDGATGPSTGARFEGTNRIANEADGSEYVWIRPCTVTLARRPERFAYDVGDRYDGTPATSWDIEIEPSPAGCRITQRFQHRPQGLSGVRQWADADPTGAAALVSERTAGLTKGMTETLQRMKATLESTGVSGAT